MISIMSTFDPRSYGPVFAPLLDTDRRRPLDAGWPDSDARSALNDLSVESAFAHTQVADRDMAACCISGVWLLHDFLDDSHKISQSIETASGSFWHGIMHRREGDFWNSKYWFHRVGQHPAFDAIAEHARRRTDFSASSERDHRLKSVPLAGAAWDPFNFVDLCEAAVSGHTELSDYSLDIQQVEWEALFDYCYYAAVGEQHEECLTQRRGGAKQSANFRNLNRREPR
jgi:hypothetical protein